MSSRVYLVMDQHGMNTRVYFANLDDARSYATECSAPPVPGWRPGSYIVVPIVVWDSLEERKNAPEESP